MIFDDKELRKALRKRASDLDIDSARFLVDSYYQMQELRITSDNRVRAVQQGVDDNAADFMAADGLTHMMDHNELRIGSTSSAPQANWASGQDHRKALVLLLLPGCWLTST